MVSSLITATITGWAVIITIAFCMGSDVISIVTSPLGQPLAQIAFNSLGKNVSIALLVFLWFSSICNCSILMVAASRETFAFARGSSVHLQCFSPAVLIVCTRSRSPRLILPSCIIFEPDAGSCCRVRRCLLSC